MWIQENASGFMYFIENARHKFGIKVFYLENLRNFNTNFLTFGFITEIFSFIYRFDVVFVSWTIFCQNYVNFFDYYC